MVAAVKLVAPWAVAADVLAVVAATEAVGEVLEVRVVRVVAWAVAKGAALTVVVATREEVVRGAVRGAATAVEGRVAVRVAAMAVEVRVAAPIAQL
jgi:hypothetical protein